MSKTSFRRIPSDVVGADVGSAMFNIQVTHEPSVDNARSESSLAINPNNPQQIVAGSKRFINYHTYDFTLATSYSTDGGRHWKDSTTLFLLPGWRGISDPALAWDDSGNVFLVALAFNNPPNPTIIGIAVYKSGDGGKTWSDPKLIHRSPSDDKQWAAGDANPGSPFHGRVYAAWHSPLNGPLCFARTLDHGETWIGAGASPAGTAIAPSSFSPEVNVGADGTVYIIFRDSDDGKEIRMVKSTDGGNSFQAATSPATGIGAFGITTLPGGNFRVVTVPTACDFSSTVLVAWADNREGNSRIYYAASTDGGTSWNTPPSGQPLLTSLPIDANMFHFHPQIVFRPDGVLGCAFYEFGPKPVTPKIDTRMALSFDNGVSFSQLVTVTDQPWDPTIDAPWVRANRNLTFIGEYFGFDASNNGFYPLWTDTRTGIQELWMDILPRPWNEGDLTTVNNIVSVSGHFSTGDQRHLVVVGTAHGRVHEIFWKPAQQGIEGHHDLPVTFGEGTIVSVASLYNSDQQRHLVLVGKKDGKVHEIFWKPETVGVEGHDDLPVSFGQGTIAAVSGLYNNHQQRHLVVVGTTAGKVHEIFWKADTAGVEGHDDLPVNFTPGSIVGVAAFYNTDQQRHVVVVGTTAGKLHEIFWKADTVGIEGHDDLPVTFGSAKIVAISGFYDPNKQRHVVVVGTTDGQVHQVYWKAATVGIEAHSTVTHFSAGSIRSVAGFYSATDQIEQIVVGLTSGLLREFWVKPNM